MVDADIESGVGTGVHVHPESDITNLITDLSERADNLRRFAFFVGE